MILHVRSVCRQGFVAAVLSRRWLDTGLLYRMTLAPTRTDILGKGRGQDTHEAL